MLKGAFELLLLELLPLEYVESLDAGLLCLSRIDDYDS